LIETPKEGYAKFSGDVKWLFDIGTLCHMIGMYKVLENVKGIDTVEVRLPDGNQALASKVGMVNHGSNLILRDVLFVPKLTCNLISIY